MTVKTKEEMNDVRSSMPSNDAPMPPSAQQVPNNNIPDHTHPEYDQLLVKVQEIEDALAKMQMGGINSECSSKPSNQMEKTSEKTNNKKEGLTMELSEEKLRSILREELKGVPEEKQNKKDLSNDSAAKDIPQTNQPANGVAPSGGGFDSNDKMGDKAGDAAASQTDKPSSDYKRMDVQKNSLDDKKSKVEMAKNLMEQAKKLLKEAMSEDPTEPMPGETSKEPEKMDGQEDNKSPNGGTEDPSNMSASKENLSNDKLVEEVYNYLKKNAQEEFDARMASKRQSLVGSSAVSQSAASEHLDAKTASTSAIKEYLQKTGNSRVMQIISGANKE